MTGTRGIAAAALMQVVQRCYVPAQPGAMSALFAPREGTALCQVLQQDTELKGCQEQR